MPDLSRILPVLSIASVAIASLIAFPTGAEIGSSTETVAPSQPTSLEDLIRLFKEDEPPLGSRGGVCPVSPSPLRFVVWSDRPLFLWHAWGNSSQMELQQVQLLRAADSDPQRMEVLWSQTLDPTRHSAVYDGDALEPGGLYKWQLTWRRWNEQTRTWTPEVVDSTFQVMESAQREVVSQQLEAIAAPLRANGASAEAIALRQAQYLNTQGLKADALQSLYSVSDSSILLTQSLEELIPSLCQTGSTGSGN